MESQTQMDNDSIHSQEPQAGQDGKKEKSRRPPSRSTPDDGKSEQALIMTTQTRRSDSSA